MPPVSELSELKPSPGEHQKRYQGGETRGLQLLAERIAWEELALSRGIVMPNQYCPDLLGPPRSLSAYLRHGCISVRRCVEGVGGEYGGWRGEENGGWKG